ncbi:MAG: hypothetical protein J7502_18255 [Flavisolibacter sp.]|nr:hypothetical protein [Flavisolibacter sp.]
MKAFLKDQKTHKDVVQISFTDEELGQLEWEGDDEFCFQGEMYDVIQKERNGNKTIILCIPDKKETALLNEYQRTHKRNVSHSATVQLFSIQFVLPDDCSLQQPQKTIEKYPVHHSFSLQNPASTVILPPPDVCTLFTTL